jgi:hypothetical protein
MAWASSVWVRPAFSRLARSSTANCAGLILGKDTTSGISHLPDSGLASVVGLLYRACSDHGALNAAEPVGSVKR